MGTPKQNESERELHEKPSGNQPLLAETEKPGVTVEYVDHRSSTLRYKLTDIPPVPVCIFVAMQHVLVSLASALAMSTVISDNVCAEPGHIIRSRLFGSTLFMQGICTVFQTLVGVRLPVFQGPSSSFLVPLMAISQLPGWNCEEKAASSVEYGNVTDLVTGTSMANVTYDTPYPNSLNMYDKLQQLSGSLMVASMLEVVVGGLGLLRLLLRYIGPLTVAPTIALIGLSLFRLPVMYARFNPLIALGSAVLVVVFSLYMSRIKIPIPDFRKGHERTYLPIFQLLPVLLAILVMWLLCYVLTVAGAFPDDKNDPLYYSRTDAKLSIIRDSPWFQITYPGQFGPPSINLAATIGFLVAVLASLVESIGDYYATAKCCQVMAPPDHAMSRGIFMEGLGSVLSGAVGACHSTTSYSVNVAMISLTQTASRSVLVVAGGILLVLSCIGKVGAAFATLPAPIMGGILLVTFGLLAMLGISTLKYTDMNSNRNMLVTGVAFLSGLSVPAFVQEHADMLATGNEIADQVIRVVLGTPMFLGGLVALILDNTAPGTDLERGIIGWKMSHSGGGEKHDTATASAHKSPSPVTTNKGDVAVSGDLHKTTHGGDNENSRKGKQQGQAELQDEEREVTEDEVFAFECLEGRLSSPMWRFIPFLPPNAIRRRRGEAADHGRDAAAMSNGKQDLPV